jgi:hypothetical protein
MSSVPFLRPGQDQCDLSKRGEIRVRGPPTGEGGAADCRPSLCGESHRADTATYGINVTERLFVSSVSVADVNWTVIGGLHDGLNVTVPVIV